MGNSDRRRPGQGQDKSTHRASRAGQTTRPGPHCPLHGQTGPLSLRPDAPYVPAMVQLPRPLSDWFAAKGWALHPHQLSMLDRAADPASLLIAPTGGGKTLAGFLPSLAELGAKPAAGLHTLYISPLKALTADIRRNLRAPVEGAGLAIRIEDRTGDTSYTQRRRQRADPPHILLTTPESLALLLSYEDAPRMFGTLQRVIVDEIHALAESKRGDQLMLCLARLQGLAPGLRRVGLSATVEDPPALARFLARHPDPCAILQADPGPDPDIAMLETDAPPPWAGGGGRYAIPAILNEVARHRTTLIFHNTRAQAEIFFHELWQANEDNLPIAIHHGSLAREQRDRVEAAMVAGALRAIVCTGTLDLGIDWGDVDLVIQVGAPKNVKRLVQRIGRANHRYNAPSKALLVPANRFEVVECHAALAAVRERTLDGEPRGPGPRDVLCQHILICAASAPFDADALYTQVTEAGPYAALTRAEFDACLDFTATGGYALRAYDRWQRLVLRSGLWQLRDPRAALVIRQNIGTIIDTETLKVRLKNRMGGQPLGEVEESFAATLTPGDTFLIGGQVVRYEGLHEMTVEVTRQPGRDPKVAVFNGTKFATSTLLTQRILALFQQPDWPDLPGHTARWLARQREVSRLPEPGRLLVESFPHEGREHLCVYGFAGRNAQQTLGLLLTKRMEEEGLHPLGFVATDYATLIWGLDRVDDPLPLFDPGRLRAGLEGWLAGNAVMKRTFRNSAIIAGLIERSHQGRRKSGRQATFSSDILYDTLHRYDPGHLMLQITREEAMRGLVDFGRVEDMLARIGAHADGGIDALRLDRVTPLAAPLFLEPGRVPVEGAGRERLMAETAERLMLAAGLT
jgi:ATP-dependent Lhr-like helicase